MRYKVEAAPRPAYLALAVGDRFLGSIAGEWRLRDVPP